MAWPLAVEHPGGHYHVTARGVTREDTLWQDADRKEFLNVLGDAHGRWGLVLRGYRLMSNHYHPAASLAHKWIAEKIKKIRQLR